MIDVNIKKELSSKKCLVLLFPKNSYSKVIVDVAKQLSGRNVCYVTLNKTFYYIDGLLKKNKILVDNFVYIDATSKPIKNMPDQTNRCYFISSPGALTELSLKIKRFLRHNFEYIIFDSLTTLRIYNDKKVIKSFISSIVNKIQKSNTKAVFYSVNAEDNNLIKESNLLTDNIIEVK